MKIEMQRSLGTVQAQKLSGEVPSFATIRLDSYTEGATVDAPSDVAEKLVDLNLAAVVA